MEERLHLGRVAAGGIGRAVGGGDGGSGGELRHHISGLRPSLFHLIKTRRGPDVAKKKKTQPNNEPNRKVTEITGRHCHCDVDTLTNNKIKFRKQKKNHGITRMQLSFLFFCVCVCCYSCGLRPIGSDWSGAAMYANNEAAPHAGFDTDGHRVRTITVHSCTT